MFLDARRIEAGKVIATEVCIVGGGIAGLVIARELAAHKIHCCVIESGGHEPDDATRDLYRGESVGVPYEFADGCRSRYLGGSSNCWGGWCRPLDALDYERRSWVANSGWPFGPDELAPYYERAQQVLQLGVNNYDTAYWTQAINRRDVRRYPFSGRTLIDGVSQFSPPLRAGKAFRAELAAAAGITVLLHGNVVNLDADLGAATVQRADVATLSGTRCTVQARTFVLAAGGIENARLLLASNRQAAAGLGNGNDLVGRYFMDHPRVTSGDVHLSPDWRLNKLYDHKYHYQNDSVAANGTRIAAQFFATPEVQEREGLNNARIWFQSIFPGEHDVTSEAIIRMKHRLEHKEKPGTTLVEDLFTIAMHPFQAAGFIAARLYQPHFLIRGVKMQAIVEPTPDPNSRVTLSETRDRLDMPRVRIDWRIDDNAKRTFDRMFALMRDELEAHQIARVDLDPPIGSGAWPDTFEREGTWHHMGTTRMHDSPRQGVVDRNGLVHGMNNLYVAGSSVFPTAASNFPTITLTALALRLAKHLAATPAAHA